MIEPVEILATGTGRLPEWIRVLPLGEIKLSDGREPFTVDGAAINKIAAAFINRGIDLVVDYEHQSLQGERAPAAGWIKELQARDDGLWARVDWTPQAQEYLKNREYRYFSPVLRLDPETRTPTALLHVGLTNVPAINHLPPLVAKAGAFGDAQVAQAARAKQYGIRLRPDGHVTKPGEWAGVPDEQFADPVNYLYPMPDAKQCRAAWSYWNQAGNQDPYNPAERAIIEKRIRARAKAVGMQIQEETAMKDKLQQMLALKSEATDEEILGVVQAALKSSGLLTDLAVILGLEGTATADQVKGTVTALKGGQASLEQLQGEVAALRLDIAQRQAGELVDAALKDGKLSPVQRDWALKYAQEKPDEFKAFVAAAPKVVPLTEIRVPAGKNNQEGRLSEGELTVCRQMGLAPENYLATKQGLAQAN